jgi:hypothetical protein
MDKLREVIREAIADVEREAEARKPRHPNGEAKQQTPPEPVVISLASIESEKVSWLWEPYLPAGKLTIVEGDPGAGKTWLTLAIGVKLTVEGHNVLYATAEDGLADTIRPRVEGMGADLSRFFILRGARDKKGETLPFTLAEPEVLEKAILTYHPALVVLDPIQGFLGGNVDMHRANEVRAKLAPLARIAETYGCAVVIVRHLSKALAGRSIYRGLGSIDFTAAARSVLLVGVDQEGRRAIVHHKNSVGELGPSMSFEITEGRFFWRGEVGITAADILRPDAEPEEKTALDEACEWLQGILAGGPVGKKEIERQARAAGIIGGSDILLRRAKAKLGIKAEKVGEVVPGAGWKIRGWTWSLPQDAHQDEDPPKYTDEKLGSKAANPHQNCIPPRCSREGLMSNLGKTSNDAAFRAQTQDAHQVPLEEKTPDEQVGKPKNVLQPVDELDAAIAEMVEEAERGEHR